MFKQSFAMNACRLMAVLALGLLTRYAAADSFTSTSGNVAGGAIDNTQKNANGGALPARGGTYNLDAFASDSTQRPPDDHPSRSAYGNPPVGQTLTDSTTATQGGPAFQAYSLARITYPAAGNWSSAGSYASVCGPADKNNPGGNKANCGKNPQGETATAKATIRDPWHFDPSSTAYTLDNTVTLEAGLSLQALASGDSSAQDSIQADANTDLNGLGELWSLSWGTDSNSPGTSAITFRSNPALGLDDSAIVSSLQGLISGDPTTGLSMLTQSFSFTYQLSIPADTTVQFDSSVTYDAEGATAPEPSSAATAFCSGCLLLLAGAARRMRRRTGVSNTAENLVE